MWTPWFCGTNLTCQSYFSWNSFLFKNNITTKLILKTNIVPGLNKIPITNSTLFIKGSFIVVKMNISLAVGTSNSSKTSDYALNSDYSIKKIIPNQNSCFRLKVLIKRNFYKYNFNLSVRFDQPKVYTFGIYLSWLKNYFLTYTNIHIYLAYYRVIGKILDRFKLNSNPMIIFF